MSNAPSIVMASEGIGKYGGIATYARNLAASFQQRGWKVEFVATNSRGEGFDELSKHAACHDLSDIPLSLRKPFAAASLVNRLAPDVLLLNHCSLMHYALPLIDKQIKPVVVLHNDVEIFYEVAARFQRRVFRWVAPTPKLAEEFKPRLNYRVRSRVSIIPHGINPKVFSRGEDSTTLGNSQIAFVGFIGENKGADLLPAIMARVWQDCPDAKLTIVSYGPLKPFLEDAFNQMGASDRVNFAGVLDPEGVARILSNSEVFLLPTRVEGFGLVIVEAMMCRAVPVVSRLPGITDSIIEHGRTGVLCEREAIDEFAAGVISLLSDPTRQAMLSHEAAKQAMERFSAEPMVDAYERLFREPDDRSIRARQTIAGWTWDTARQTAGERWRSFLQPRAIPIRPAPAPAGAVRG